MSVTINTLGTNSRQIIISGETSATNIIGAVNTSLTALGWTLIDTVTSGSRGLLTTKVYSAPNADTVTTKYMIIRYDLARQYWVVSCCEAWNTTTNVATNESWSGGRHILLPLQYSNCILYVFANARYAAFMGTVRGEPSAWQGVFEFEREAAEDIAANSVPCFGWTSSLTIGEPFGNIAASTATGASSPATNGFVACGFAPPRTATSTTGLTAAGTFVILTGLGEFPPSKGVITLDWSSGGITQSLNNHCGMLGSFNENATSGYVWNSTKTVISNLKLGGYTSGYITGKIYGLKITVKLGAPLDTTIVPVDANLFFSATGTNTNHALLGIHGQYKDRLATGSNRMLSAAYNSGTALGSPNQSAVVSGRYLYMATSTGFHKFDLLTLTYTYNILPATNYHAVKFDGVNNLYVTNASTTLYKINLSDDTYTTYSAGINVSGIALDDDYLYAVSSASSTTATVKKVTLSSFTEAASWTITIGTSATQVTHISTADYAGYLYVAGYGIVTRSATRLVRILTSDGSNSSIIPTGTLGNATQGAQPLHYDGESLWLTISTNGVANYCIAADKVLLSNFTLTTIFGSATVTGTTIFGVSFVYQGCTESISYAGMLPYFNNSTSAPFKFIFSDPRFPSGLTALQVDQYTTNIDSTYTTYIGQYATDQTAMYCMNTSQVIVYNGSFRNYNFNGTQTANMLIPQ